MGSKNSKNIQNFEEPTIANVIKEDHLETASDVLRALAHPLRLSIINYIDKHPDTNVNSIYNSLGLEQSITSQHLRILRNANLVNSNRDGKQILYTLNYDKLGTMNNAIKSYLQQD